MELLDLPELVLPHILSFLNYDEIARNRIVCREFNKVCWKLLNKGFHDAERCQSNALKTVKLQLPRRESERRKHPLSRKCDILVAIETRLSMLSMAFSRFIDSKLCCFIPGKVIDELFHVMHSLDCCNKDIQPPHIILQELRDVSTMAIEHFDDKIAPTLRKKEMMSFTTPLRAMSVIESNNRPLNFSSSPKSCQGQALDVMVQDYFSKINDVAKRKPQVVLEENKGFPYIKLIRRQSRKIKELETVINEQSTRLSNNETIIADLKRQFSELKTYLVRNFGPSATKQEGMPSLNQKPEEKEIPEPLSKKRKI